MNCIILTYLNIPTFVWDNSDRILVLNTSVAAVSAVVFAVIKRILIDWYQNNPSKVHDQFGSTRKTNVAISCMFSKQMSKPHVKAMACRGTGYEILLQAAIHHTFSCTKKMCGGQKCNATAAPIHCTQRRS